MATTVKEEARRLIECLPEDASWEDLHYEIYGGSPRRGAERVAVALRSAARLTNNVFEIIRSPKSKSVQCNLVQAESDAEAEDVVAEAGRDPAAVGGAAAPRIAAPRAAAQHAGAFKYIFCL